jgi:two-component system, chemotaxis family, protein-glutamate methylesterase/glutaminase
MTAARPPAPLTPRATARPRVLVIDDSAVVRGLVARWIEADDRLELAGASPDGEQGVRRAAELQPDLVVLDVEMPRMDGLTALPLILKAAPGARVVMASTLTRQGAEVTIRALSLGAADYAAKPAAGQAGGADAYRFDLLNKLDALCPRPAPPRRVIAPLRPDQRPPAYRPSLVAIGASTGGPQALRELAAALPADTGAPILITQHMPPVFTALLAEHLSKLGLPAAEAADGEVLRPGRIYLAPGDFHMRVRQGPDGLHAALDQGPKVNFCRPAVDPLFESLADAGVRGVLAVVLTGMGSDGREGARRLYESGAHVIAQDRQSSVVWGMPGSVIEAGLADMVLPLNRIGPEIARRLKGLP